MIERLDIRRRAKAAGIHLLVSLLLALFVAAIVFGLWYPGAYRLLSGGRSLFFLVVTVDVVLGPLLTFAVFNLRKGWKHLRRDLAIIGILQLAALGYGLHTAFIARPIAMVFEVDRFRVLDSGQIRLEELPSAPAEYRNLPLTGPWTLGTRKPRSGDESNNALFAAVDGVDIGQRPMFWQPYADSIPDVLKRARPLRALLDHYPEKSTDLHQRIQDLKLHEANLTYLPVMARGDWVAILDGTGAIAAYLPVDGFF